MKGGLKLKCPYCNCDLIEGFIDSPQCSLRWHSKDAKFLEKYTVFGGEVLCNNNLFIKCYRCKNCNKIIIDINELEKFE
jgi:hypothetical protein